MVSRTPKWRFLPRIVLRFGGGRLDASGEDGIRLCPSSGVFRAWSHPGGCFDDVYVAWRAPVRTCTRQRAMRKGVRTCTDKVGRRTVARGSHDADRPVAPVRRDSMRCAVALACVRSHALVLGARAVMPLAKRAPESYGSTLERKRRSRHLLAVPAQDGLPHSYYVCKLLAI